MNKVEGLDTVLANLNREINGIENKTMDGLWDAGLQLQGVSQEHVPVKYGNLRASAYTRRGSTVERLEQPKDADKAPMPSGSTPANAVEVGYTAAYGVFVHEDLEASHKEGQAKFLEEPLRRNQGNILEIVKRRASVK